MMGSAGKAGYETVISYSHPGSGWPYGFVRAVWPGAGDICARGWNIL